MARSSGSFVPSLLVASKSFVAGCFGCLGVGAALFISTVLGFGVFGSQVVAVIRTVQVPVLTLVRGLDVAPAVPVVKSEVPVVDIWVSKDSAAATTRVVQVKLPVQEPLFIAARGPKGTSVRFVVQVVHPNGQIVPFGTGFVTDASGQVLVLGAWSDPPTVPGVFRVDALIGTTIVGSTVVTIVS